MAVDHIWTYSAGLSSGATFLLLSFNSKLLLTMASALGQERALYWLCSRRIHRLAKSTTEKMKAGIRKIKVIGNSNSVELGVSTETPHEPWKSAMPPLSCPFHRKYCSLGPPNQKRADSRRTGNQKPKSYTALLQNPLLGDGDVIAGGILDHIHHLVGLADDFV